jgi:hypothetical protein
MKAKISDKETNQIKRLQTLKLIHSENPIIIKSLNNQIKTLTNGKH